MTIFIHLQEPFGWIKQEQEARTNNYNKVFKEFDLKLSSDVLKRNAVGHLRFRVKLWGPPIRYF